MHSRLMRHLLCLTLCCAGAPLLASEPAAQPKADRWASAMQNFEKLDKESPSTPGGVVFVGSSSIRLWKVDEAFPNWNAINRGFGGSQLGDSVRHVELLVIRHKPRAVVVYAGDNDINGGKTPEQVSQDFAAFEKAVHAALPETHIFFVAIKPSTRRWQLADTMQKANRLIETQCEEKPNCHFVDIWDAMLGDDGMPRPELLQKDGLHLTAAGYDVWNSAIKHAFEAASLSPKQAAPAPQ